MIPIYCASLIILNILIYIHKVNIFNKFISTQNSLVVTATKHTKMQPTLDLQKSTNAALLHLKQRSSRGENICFSSLQMKSEFKRNLWFKADNLQTLSAGWGLSEVRYRWMVASRSQGLGTVGKHIQFPEDKLSYNYNIQKAKYWQNVHKYIWVSGKNTVSFSQ